MLLARPMTLFVNVKDNNVEQALRVLKRKLQRDGFFKIVKIRSNYEKLFFLGQSFVNSGKTKI